MLTKEQWNLRLGMYKSGMIDFDDIYSTIAEHCGKASNSSKPIVMRRFRVNMLHRGKERWKYCRTIERARKLQIEATAGGLCSIIYEKVGKSYVALNGA